MSLCYGGTSPSSPCRGAFTQRQCRNDDADKDDTQAQHLESIEGLLREHSETLQSMRRQPGSSSSTVSPIRRNDLTPSHHEQPLRSTNGSPLPFSIWAFNHSRSKLDSPGRDHDVGPPITIPLGHQTSTSNVLVLPQCRSLLGDYPEEFFFRVEGDRPRAAAARSMMSSNWDRLQEETPIDRADCNRHLGIFLTRVHPFHPFLDRDDIISHYEKVMETGVDFNNPSALVLAILALGATVSDPIDRKAEERSGEALIQKALKILFASWTFTFSGDVLISQALVLCALYFTYTVEPLMAWRLIHMASTSIQQLLSR